MHAEDFIVVLPDPPGGGVVVTADRGSPLLLQRDDQGPSVIVGAWLISRAARAGDQTQSP